MIFFILNLSWPPKKKKKRFSSCPHPVQANEKNKKITMADDENTSVFSSWQTWAKVVILVISLIIAFVFARNFQKSVKDVPTFRNNHVMWWIGFAVGWIVMTFFSYLFSIFF